MKRIVENSTTPDLSTPAIGLRFANRTACFAIIIAVTLPVSLRAQLTITESRTAGHGSHAIVAGESTAKEGGDKTGVRERVIIRAIGPESEPKDVTWLGVGAEESPEALSAQLDLKPGEGLLVTFVAEDSPAAKAGLQKNDLIVELEGQTLVHPAQLRKLVQMRNPGDEVQVVFYRGGKKKEVTVPLAKTKQTGLLEEERDWGNLRELDLRDLGRQFKERPIGDAIREEIKVLQQSLAASKIDRDKISAEVKWNVEEARKNLEKALRQATNAARTFGPAANVLKELAHSGVRLNEKSIVTVKTSEDSVSTMVKTDDAGTYVITANPKKHLTARDKEGKLLFEGEIETSEQQEKVPAEVWEKVEPMLDQMKSSSSEAEER